MVTDVTRKKVRRDIPGLPEERERAPKDREDD